MTSFDVHIDEKASSQDLSHSPLRRPSVFVTSIATMSSVMASTASTATSSSSGYSTFSTSCHTPLSSDGSTLSSEPGSSSSSSYFVDSTSADGEARSKKGPVLQQNSAPDSMAVHSVVQSTGSQPQSSGRRQPSSHHSKYPRPSGSSQAPLTESDDESYVSVDDSSRSHYRLRQRKQRRVTEDANYTSEDCCPFDISQVLHTPELPPIGYFSACAGVPQPVYEHVLENDYSQLEEQLRRDASASIEDDSLSRQLSRESHRLWVCDCAPPSREEILAGRLGCEQGCINRALYIECGPRCPAYAWCSNRQFQLRLYAPTEPYYCGPEKGWGLRARKPIPKGAFIVEYAGEVIDFGEFRRRIRIYEKAKHAHHYFMSLGPEHFIDAGTKGNWARFVNHSCEPNAETQKWTVNGRLRIGFFAKYDIPAGEEITIDYQFVQYGVVQQKCYCGTPSCSGIMGVTSKQLQDKVRLKDTRAVERGILQLLTWKTLRTADDVTFLLQVMVQEYLTRYSKMELLKLLADTSNETYLKLFRQYNGLELLTSYMCDAAQNDWDLKYQILLCLDHIPVSEQKQVQTDSCLMDIVKQWTLDPHFCLSRPFAPPTTTVPSPKSTQPGAQEVGQSSTEQSSSAETPVSTSDPSPINDRTDGSANAACPPCPRGDPQRNESDQSHRNGVRSPCDQSLPPSLGLPPGAVNSSTDGATDTAAAAAGAVDKTESVITAKAGEEKETDGVAKASEYKVYSAAEEQLIVDKIRVLASRILERWLSLPVETYRIPRIERQETEQSILRSAEAPSSTLISWGTSPKEDSFNSWALISQDASNNTKFSESPTPKRSRDKQAGRNRQRKLIDREFIRAKHREQFEADMKAAESAATELLVMGGEHELQSASAKDSIADCVRSLLLKALARRLALVENPESYLQEWMASLSKRLCELSRKSDTDGLLAYLKKLAEADPDHDENANAASVEKPASKKLPTPEAISPPWCAAVDPATGRTYYYNSVTKAVQWDPPNKEPPQEPKPKPDNPPSPQKKRDFMKEAYACVLKLLRPYRLPNCLTGRIESDDDMKHLAKKLAFALAGKEQQRCRHKTPILTPSLIERFRRKVTHYMTSRGEVYVRSRHREGEEEEQEPTLKEKNNGTVLENCTLSDCDMEIDDSDV
ncbi:hypothetical protein AAHC03_017025 [Spirometra sp. Aus1]